MPSIVPDTGYKMVNKTDLVFGFINSKYLKEEQDSNVWILRHMGKSRP